MMQRRCEIYLDTSVWPRGSTGSVFNSRMSLRDLTSGSCSGGASSGASGSAAGGPLSALATRVLGGPASGVLGQDAGAPSTASELNELVQSSLISENTHGEEALIPPASQLPAELAQFSDLPPQLAPAPTPAGLVPPAHLPRFFPPNFLRPFNALPDPDPNAVTAEFEAAFDSASIPPPHPLPLDDPLVRSQRERTRQLFPAADPAFVDRQVHEFMAELSLHGRPPVAPHAFKGPPPMYYPMPPPLMHPFPHPPPLYHGLRPPENAAFLHTPLPPANAAPNAAPAVPNEAETRASGSGPDPALRDSIFQEFVGLLRGEGLTGANPGALDAPLEAGGDLSAERAELDEFDARVLGALSNAQRDWGDEFTSLDSFGASSALAARAHEEEAWAGAETGELDDAFRDTYAADLGAFLGGDPAGTAYAFAPDNEFAGASAAAALAEGARLRGAGELARALRALEAAVHRPADDPHPPLEPPDRARAWLLLGTTHAERDDDVRAIQALSRVGTADEAAADAPPELARTCAAALLALAVSYTNELDAPRAVVHVRRWLDAQARVWGDGFAAAEGGFAGDGEEEESDEVTARLVVQLRAAADRHPEHVDVHLALGVVHSLNRDYDAAGAAFRCAVSMRKDDARLWNKLGATLANGGESDDALRAYRRAVDLCPTYTRAWVNVGTAYGNRGEHAKAVRYYLRALAATHGGAGEEEEGAGRGRPGAGGMGHVWGYLRSALFSVGMPELAVYAEERNLEAFRVHFPF